MRDTRDTSRAAGRPTSVGAGLLVAAAALVTASACGSGEPAACALEAEVGAFFWCAADADVTVADGVVTVAADRPGTAVPGTRERLAVSFPIEPDGPASVSWTDPESLLELDIRGPASAFGLTVPEGEEEPVHVDRHASRTGDRVSAGGLDVLVRSPRLVARFAGTVFGRTDLDERIEVRAGRIRVPAP